MSGFPVNLPQHTASRGVGLLAVGALLFVGSPIAQTEPVARKSPGAVTVARVPDGGVVPDVALDAKGVLHLAFGKGEDAFYTQSRDGGKTFSKPVRLNRRSMTVTVGMERGPKLALGKKDVIQVVWQGHYQKGGGVWVTRSTDGGKTFASERDILDAKTGIDMPTITADSAGHVIVLWLDGRIPENAENKVSSPLFMARSNDNGATFSANVALKTDFPGRGCACCMLWGKIVGEELVVAFRTGYRDIRDMYMLRGPRNGNDFHASLVSADNWKFEGCPMSGPRFALNPAASGSSRLLVAWMSEQKVYWTRALDTGGEKFAPRQAFPKGGDGNYPMILQNAKGQILFLWTRGGQAQWAIYEEKSPKSTVPMASGSAGESHHRPSAFVRPGGDFVIVL